MKAISTPQNVRRHIENAEQIVFLDTCSFLDIQRLPFKEKQFYKPADYDALLELLKRLRSGALVFCCSGLLKYELANNQRQLEAQQTEYLNRFASLPILEYINGATFDGQILVTNAIAKLHEMSNQVYDALIEVLETTAILEKAYHRINQGLLPSRGSGKDIYDAVVWETFIEMVLGFGSHPVKAVFVTSNTKDFPKLLDGKAELASELHAIDIHNLAFAHNFRDAINFLN